MFPKRLVFDSETLTGSIQGRKASDIEERWARAVAKIPDWGYTFRVRISPLTGELSTVARNLPGELEIDFLMQRGDYILPILIQGEIGHFYTPWQAVTDELKQSGINKALKGMNAQPVLAIPKNKNDLWRLSTQEHADALAREILL